MTMVLSQCESLTFAFYQSLDLFIIFIEPVLVTFGFKPESFFAGIDQSSFDMGTMFFYRKILSGFESSLSCKSPLNWLLVQSLEFAYIKYSSGGLLFPMFRCNADFNFGPD